MLVCFNIIFAQSEQDKERLTALGAQNVLCLGNLKYDAAALPCNEGELVALKESIGSRPVWLAASTHPGEETMVGKVHQLLSVTYPDLLTVIVPRHPQRGENIAAELAVKWKVARRSCKDPIKPDTHIYIADTLGELGLFYRLCEIVFMGGSLVPHGGQNPLEPARLSCALLTGPLTYNFADMYKVMEQSGCCLRVGNAGFLAAQIDNLIHYPEQRDAMQKATRQWLEGKGGTADRILEMLEPVFYPKGK
jgi:3-deoxy-D-manno-octulosonic-acid transferase